MKKKLTALLLITALTISLSACGNNQANTEAVAEETVETQTPEEPVEEEELVEEEAPMEEAEAAPVEIAEEDYYYTAMLNTMLLDYHVFWWSPEEGMNQPGTAEFAVEDINSDGVKELLVTYDALSPRGIYRETTIYKYDEITNVITAKTEYYNDGTIVTYDVDENFIPGYEKILIEKNDVVSASVTTRNNEWDNYLYEEGFPTEKDIDGDGIFYIWTGWENNSPTTEEEIFQTEEEYRERIAKAVEGKEKLDLTWHALTAENIKAVIPSDIRNEKAANAIEDRASYLEKYIKTYYRSYNNSLDGVLNIIGVHGGASEDRLMEDLLPSAEFVYEDGAEYTYAVSKEAVERLSEEAFNNKYSMEDILEDDFVVDNGDGTINMLLDYLNGEGDDTSCHVLSAYDEDGKIFAKGVVPVNYGDSYSIAYSFEVVLEENENSPLAGYKVIDLQQKQLYNFGIVMDYPAYTN